MSRPPGLVDQINYVRRALSDHCDPPLQLYFTALFPALWQAFLQLYAVDLQTIFFSMIRTIYFPGHNIAHVRGKDRRRRPKPKTFLRRPRRWLNWDPYEATGRMIGNWLGGTPTTPPTALRIVFTWFNVIERLSFYFLIVNVTVNFWYNYASALHESEACKAARQPWLTALGGTQGASGILERWPTICPDIVKARGSVQWNVNTGSVTNGAGAFTYSCAIRQDPDFDDPNWRCRIAIEDLNTGELHTGEWQTGSGGVSSVSIDAPEDHVFSIGVNSEGFSEISDQQVTIIGFTPDPV